MLCPKCGYQGPAAPKVHEPGAYKEMTLCCQSDAIKRGLLFATASLKANCLSCKQVKERQSGKKVRSE